MDPCFNKKYTLCILGMTGLRGYGDGHNTGHIHVAMVKGLPHTDLVT